MSKVVVGSMGIKRKGGYDVVVVGAGPAGCSAATVLAEAGHRVAILERQPLPRYRIGESLIPHCWYPLERLGVVEKLHNSGFAEPKLSVQFVSTKGVRARPFYFFQHTDHPKSRTWQVSRAEFDAMLLARATESGARLLPETTATDLMHREGAVTGVIAKDAHGEFELEARVTMDASGQDLFSVSKNRWRVADPDLRKVALWRYYDGAMRDPGNDRGATTIAYLERKGWFWYLPLAGDRTSVGIVANADYLYRDGMDRERIFEREVGLQPWIKEHLEGASPAGEFRTMRDFSYCSRYCAQDGLVLVGDAFAFLDPVFSSGVYFALQGGVMAGDAVNCALRAGDCSSEQFSEYGAAVCASMEPMRNLVHAFYDPDFSFGEFFSQHPEMKEKVTDVLIGDLGQDFTGLFEAMARFARLPDPLIHGHVMPRTPS